MQHPHPLHHSPRMDTIARLCSNVTIVRNETEIAPHSSHLHRPVHERPLPVRRITKRIVQILPPGREQLGLLISWPESSATQSPRHIGADIDFKSGEGAGNTVGAGGKVRDDAVEVDFVLEAGGVAEDDADFLVEGGLAAGERGGECAGGGEEEGGEGHEGVHFCLRGVAVGGGVIRERMEVAKRCGLKTVVLCVDAILLLPSGHLALICQIRHILTKEQVFAICITFDGIQTKIA